MKQNAIDEDNRPERGRGIAIGIALGLLFGLLIDQIAVGLVLGIAVGTGIDSMIIRRANKERRR